MDMTKVGDGATVHGWSDSHAYTVVAVSASGKTVTLQRDSVKLNDGWRPDAIPGGFFAHVANNGSQKWDMTPDPNGAKVKARLTKRGWRSAGSKVSLGVKREFYDYNF